eukprot:CAMPEP_0168622088 /NCGR_PEP_ID=MMETSP0449_2-20121227/8065_1 /TAXON_ID=1082188 /ORGANISM="Strombidium rassoulzadegani, Strain ras09" /LENGTH=55 /DNA_ID=CAMNT_0008663299 /DNA_START=273 /DNA_END=440 /DNA_ORIENTATION=+
MKVIKENKVVEEISGSDELEFAQKRYWKFGMPLISDRMNFIKVQFQKVEEGVYLG